MKISVVIPCLNEAETIVKSVTMARELLSSLDEDGEIVVSDNGSTDGSKDLASRAGARVVVAPQKGYGFALIYGIGEANGDIIVMGDADATYDFREADKLVRAVIAGADLAMGSRLRGNIERGAMPFLHRYLGTPCLTFLIRLFFKMRISDCNCGMRAFSKSAFKKMNIISGGMEFASEMLIRASECGLNVVEFPISLAKDSRNRTPHLNTWRDGWRHLRFILLFAPHVVFDIPGKILTTVFGVLTLLLCIGPVSLAGKFIDYHHLFYAIPLFFVGIQLLWFSFIMTRFKFFVGIAEKNRQTQPFHLEFWLLSGAVTISFGVVVFVIVLAQWIASGMNAFVAVRPSVLALVSMLFGIITISNALLTSMFDLRFKIEA